MDNSSPGFPQLPSVSSLLNRIAFHQLFDLPQQLVRCPESVMAVQQQFDSRTGLTKDCFLGDFLEVSFLHFLDFFI